MTALVASQRPVYHLYRFAWAGLDWLYPPHCGGCGKAGQRWCSDCQQNVQLLPANVCPRCGNAVISAGICELCRANPPVYEALRSWAIFGGPLRNALHRLKYKRDIALGEILARHLISLYLSLKWEVDLVVSTPIGVARRAERGYNQATLLALPLALAIGKPLRFNALRKIRETRSQVGLSLAERRSNVHQAFQADAEVVRSKSVLIIDDVATSGATLQACATALLESGARRVFGLTLARAALDPVRASESLSS